MSHPPNQDPSPFEFYLGTFLVTALVLTWLAAVATGIVYLATN